MFLRARLRDHVSAIIAQVKTAHPNAKFELLFPYDVNHPEPAGIHQLGGPLNRFINLPIEWETKPDSGFDRIKMEALDFGAVVAKPRSCPNGDRIPARSRLAARFGAPLVPVFRSGYAWEKEIAMATGAGIPYVNLWAFDHVCIYGLPPLPGSTGRSQRY